MLNLVLLLTTIYLIYLIIEKQRNDRALRSFRHVIHVNGIRGKTGTARLIDAALRAGGYRVFTKTTGTTPFYIDVKGEEHLIRRNTPSNIKEQLRMIRMAHREKAEILILECMAVSPELQKASQELIVKGTLNVITNVRYDHIFDMGETLPEIAESLSGTIPEHGMLFTADPDFYDYFSKKCREKHSEAVLCLPSEAAPHENLAIAFEIAKRLGVSESAFKESLSAYREDFGSSREYLLPSGSRFLNLFSVNDPISTKKVMAEYPDVSSAPCFVYNHRADRPDRLLLFARHFFPGLSYRSIVVIGENRSLAVRILKKHGCHDVSACADPSQLLSGSDASEKTLIGIGNIKGAGYALIEALDAAEQSSGKGPSANTRKEDSPS